MKAKLTLITCIFTGLVLGNVSAKEAINAETKEVVNVEAKEDVNAVLTEGKITQDYDAALAYAKEKKLPVLLIFTGSDWCGWCKIMDKNVFTTPEWSEIAKNRLVQVCLNFPNDKSLVPEKYHARNEKLKVQYNIKGYPTYCLLDYNETVIGTLRAGKTKTPASFKAEVDNLLIQTDAGMKKFCATVKSKDAVKIASYYKNLKAMKKRLKAATKVFNNVKAETIEAEKRFNDSFKAGKINNMTSEVKAQYEQALVELVKAEKHREEWLKTIDRNAKPSPEVLKAYKELQSAVNNAKSRVASFL